MMYADNLVTSGVGSPVRIGHAAQVEGYGLLLDAVCVGAAQAADGSPVHVWVCVASDPKDPTEPLQAYCGLIRTNARLDIHAEENDVCDQMIAYLDRLGPDLTRIWRGARTVQ